MRAKCYYNEIDPSCVEWLRVLIQAGKLPPGDVDDRSIEDVDAGDLKGYEQAHFFAGIGGWPLALKWADWEGPVWTGSCPCQPLSGAGRRRGHEDERHLWPAFFRLIEEREPPIVFGEQVAGNLGLEWFAAVRLDLEARGYAVAAADLPAASIGAPHKRQRLFWVAHSSSDGRGAEIQPGSPKEVGVGEGSGGPDGRGPTERVADPIGEPRRPVQQGVRPEPGPSGRNKRLANANGGGEAGHGEETGGGRSHETGRGGASGGLGDPNGARLEGHGGDAQGGAESRRVDQEARRHVDPPGGGLADTDRMGGLAIEGGLPRGEAKDRDRASDNEPLSTSPTGWGNTRWLPCGDGKARPIEPGIMPLADGIPNRVGQIRAYGNAIVPQVAAKFIRAARDSVGG